MGSALPFAWVHTGANNIRRLAMLKLSVQSAHLYNPDSHKLVVTTQTAAAAVKQHLQSALPQNKLSILPKPSSVDNDFYTSRLFKIRLPSILDTDFLFIDSDTLLLDHLPISDLPYAPIMACRNRYGVDGFEIKTDTWAKDVFDKCGWPWQDRLSPYMNTGVILFRLRGSGHSFSEQWHEAWCLLKKQTNLYNDQPAFNHIAWQLGNTQCLPDEWNAPVRNLPQTSSRAKVFHYYGSEPNSTDHHTLWGNLVNTEMTGKRFSQDELQALLQSGKPYIGLGARPHEYVLSHQLTLAIRSLLSPRHARYYIALLLRKSQKLLRTITLRGNHFPSED